MNFIDGKVTNFAVISEYFSYHFRYLVKARLSPRETRVLVDFIQAH